jgi:copper(I)-binding protein
LLVNAFHSSTAAVSAADPCLHMRRRLCVLMCVALCVSPLPSALATEAAISVSGAWARATPPGVSIGAAYLTINNRGARPDVLIGASSPAAAAVQLHRTSVDHGMSRMRPAGAVTLAPGSTLRVEPGGLHWMLHGLRAPLSAGQSLPLTLRFRDAGDVTVQVAVRAATDSAAHVHAGR